MKRRLVILFAALLPVAASAQQRSEAEMAQIAADFLTPKVTRAAVQIQKIESTPELSIYNRAGGGWVIVSGDERTRGAILAYSNDGFFKLENDNVKDWVGGYREQIRSLTDVRAKEGPVSPGTPIVGPLITTKWNQSDPYRNNTPTFINEYNGKKATVHYNTGCASSSIAQIMNYWQWPKSGQGKHTDIHYPSATVDFSQSEYDWENMLDEYTYTTEYIYDNDSNNVDFIYHNYWTETQADAVAKLMYDCGVALDAQYGNESGSGAYSFDIPKALCAYFDYSTDARFMKRADYQGDWDALLRSELDAGRPMYYSGDDSVYGGHAFVCDGYDDQGYFHFNFGWSGNGDGYYLTSAITPLSDNFTSNQDVVYGIHPAGQDDKVIFSDGLYYRKHNDGLELLATENIGLDGHVMIPEKVNDIPVTSITEGAFMDNPNLKSLEIGDNVKTIGVRAFDFCSSLETVTIGSSVQSIGEWAFYETAIRSVVIPSSVECIGNSAFQNCESLKSAVLGDGVKTIGKQAFASCSSLDTVSIGSSVQTIGEGAFLETAIRSVVIPSSVESIGLGAFAKCTSLKSAVIGDGVKTICDKAFALCSSLDTVTIGPSVQSIGEFAFAETAIRSVVIPSSVESIGLCAFAKCTSLKSAVIGDGVKRIGDQAFDLCSSLDTVTIGSSVETIGPRAFDSTAVRHVVIPSSVKLIDKAAFYSCESLQSLVIGDGVKTIGNQAFDLCSSLDTVSIGSSVETIGLLAFDSTAIRHLAIPLSVELIDTAAFQDCASLKSVVIGDGVKTIARNAFYFCSSLETVKWGSSVESIGDYAFSHTAISDLVLPSSLTEIGNSAFGSCYNLSSVIFPESLKSISEGAFNECSNLSSVTFPTSLSVIGDGAFNLCSSLESVDIPNSVESIGFAAFDDCASLKSVVLGSGVKTIGDGAFAENPKLTSFTCLATTPPTCDESQYGVFMDTNISKATLYVPKGRKMTYQFATPWKGFGTIKEVNPTGVEVPELTKPTDEYYLNSRIRIVDGKKYLVR